MYKEPKSLLEDSRDGGSTSTEHTRKGHDTARAWRRRAQGARAGTDSHKDPYGQTDVEG